MRAFLICALFSVFLVGCVYIPKDVVSLAVDVSNIQKETSDCLIKSIDDDLATGERTPEEVEA